MSIPFVLPRRSVRVDTSDPDALVEVQPERRRRYEWIARSRFDATLREESVAGGAILHERWSCGMRVSCDRPRGYRAFSVPLVSAGEAIWCGESLGSGDVLRVDDPWELSTSGPFAYLSFAVDEAELDAVASRLAGGDEAPSGRGNRVLHLGRTDALVARLQQLFGVLRDGEAHPEAVRLARAELLQLAAGLEGRLPSVGGPRLSPPSRRRAAVRHVEQYLEQNPGELPTIPSLCGMAGVSERTLEYAFREQIGMTPVRYLKIRRLNGVRRDLGAPEGPGRVSEVARHWGFHDLGRFAADYRAHFGELPSQTLRRTQRLCARTRRTP